MSHRIYLLPPWLRLWHWTNAALIIVLAVTGASLHFAGEGGYLVPFSLAAKIHDIAGVALACAYGFFVLANIVTGNWWQYVPKPPGVLARCLTQARFYAFGIFRGEPHPYPPTVEANFNALQAVVYWFIMYLVVPTVVVTGLIFFYPELAPTKIYGLDGLLPVAMLHYIAGAVVILFMVAHIYLGTTGVRPTSLFKMMITGWHEE
ncbi:MAG: cytochrome b/b6 domain-containing protein [Hyphomicrobiaceae bacterium]|nr:cytochrome b/b6 domain-containing protein [Hyphomicrobiaceae bacterium]